MGVLEGRVAIVTGASGGIGKSICKVLATEGADIVAHYLRDQAGVEVAAAAVKAAGRQRVKHRHWCADLSTCLVGSIFW
jgi:NAD(P)-dependent dehydrogenase (short-subunit alcohol dehydrogenase family)